MGTVPWTFNAATAVLAALLHTLFCNVDQSKTGVTIEQIIDNVRRNEALYDDIEVVLNQDYDLNGAPASFSDGREEVTNEKKQIRYVSQKGMFRVERQGSSTGGSKKSLPLDRIRAFDGKTTRLFDQGSRGNIIAGRSDDAVLVAVACLLVVRKVNSARR